MSSFVFGGTFSETLSERDQSAVYQAGLGVDVQLSEHWGTIQYRF